MIKKRKKAVQYTRQGTNGRENGVVLFHFVSLFGSCCFFFNVILFFVLSVCLLYTCMFCWGIVKTLLWPHPFIHVNTYILEIWYCFQMFFLKSVRILLEIFLFFLCLFIFSFYFIQSLNFCLCPCAACSLTVYSFICFFLSLLLVLPSPFLFVAFSACIHG